MPDNCFLKINGANGATFFFSTASFADWKKSLEFYQGVSVLAKVKKFLLTAAYWVLKRKAVTTADEFVAELRKIIPADIVLDEHDSAMISPTRDKVIIHHHGQSYEKFAVGASRDGVAREWAFYRLLEEKKPRCFTFSPLIDGETRDDLVHFTMGYAPRIKGQGGKLPLAALAEFFDLKREPDASWASCWDRLQLPFEIPVADRRGMTPVGTVHRDFKPWNVKVGNVPQLFDFESVSSGLPLEDLFNYFVDPALHFGSVSECRRILEEHHVWASAQKLLTLQGIDPSEVGRYWRWYLLERYDYFTRAGNLDLAKKILALYREKPPVGVPAWQIVAEVAGITLFAGAVRWFYALHHPLESNDGIRYLEMLRHWAETDDWHLLSFRPPLFFYFSRLLTDHGWSAENATLTVNLIAGSLLVIPVYLAARALWRKHFSGIAAACFCAVMPKLVKFSCLRLRDGLYLSFAGGAIAFWALAFRAEKTSKSVIYSFFCGVAIAAGVMCRYEMLEFLPWTLLTLPFLAFCLHKNWRRILLDPVMVMLGLIVGIVGLSLLPGMPPVWQAYVDRLRMHFWSWRIWGLR